MSRSLWQGLPYVPGLAEGRLCLGPPTAQGQIAVVTMAQLDALTIAPAAMVILQGAPLAHPLLTLFARGVPAILLTQAQADALPIGQPVWLDGRRGLLGLAQICPANKQTLAPLPARLITADGVGIELRCSLGNVSAAAQARSQGAHGIGLLRSELLAADGATLPDQAVYRAELARILAAAGGLPANIRLLDFSVDKCPDWLPTIPLMLDPLGLRGVRLYTVPPVDALLQSLLAAIAELASDYTLTVMLPYVTHLTEFLCWRDDVRTVLPACVPVGTMVETPAAALAIADLLEQADYVALGCNDLMQCLFGADRDVPELSGYLDPYAPVFYRFMHWVAVQATDQMARVQVCGLAAQLPGVLPLMIGLGYRVFSVEPRMLPYLAACVAETDSHEARRLVRQVMAARDSQAVQTMLLDKSQAD